MIFIKQLRRTMTAECDLCGQEDPYCQCELYELRKRVEELEDAFKKMATYAFKLDATFRELCSALGVPDRPDKESAGME